MGELTDSATILVKDGIDILEKGGTHEPRVFDNLLAINVTETGSAAVFWRDPILGRNLVIDTGKGDGDGSCRVARNAVVRALFAGAVNDGVELIGNARGTENVGRAGIDIRKPAANTGLFSVKGHVVEVDGPVSALGAKRVVINIASVLGRVCAAKFDFTRGTTVGSTAQGDTKNGAFDSARRGQGAEKVAAGSAGHGHTEDAVKGEALEVI